MAIRESLTPSQRAEKLDIVIDPGFVHHREGDCGGNCDKSSQLKQTQSNMQKRDRHIRKFTDAVAG